MIAEGDYPNLANITYAVNPAGKKIRERNMNVEHWKLLDYAVIIIAALIVLALINNLGYERGYIEAVNTLIPHIGTWKP